MIKFTRILDIMGDDVITVFGVTERIITHPAPIHQAQSESAITFCSKDGGEGFELIQATKAGVVVCKDGVVNSNPTLIIVENPRLSFLRLVQALFIEPLPSCGIHPMAVVDPEAEIHPDAYIGPFVYIDKGCKVGAGTIIYGHAHIYSRTRIGCNVIIHAGTVIGADGFGYERIETGQLERFPHIGGVFIEDDVEIGANTCVDRGVLGDTVICEGAKIDNLVHIAHNVVVGRHAVVIAHAMVGGSTHIGDYAWVAPSACLREKISIGTEVIVGLGAVVVKDVPKGTTVMGVPAREAEEYKRILRALKRLIGQE